MRKDKVLISNEDGEVWINYYPEKDWWVVHSSINSWSLAKYKEYLRLFGNILNQLKLEGITSLYAIPREPSDKKWEELFGFKQIGWLNETYPVMRLEYGD